MFFRNLCFCVLDESSLSIGWVDGHLAKYFCGCQVTHPNLIPLILISHLCCYCYSRIILEADASTVVQKVALRNDDIPLGEQTVAQVSIVPLVAISSTTVYDLFCYVLSVYGTVSSNERSFV